MKPDTSHKTTMDPLSNTAHLQLLYDKGCAALYSAPPADLKGAITMFKEAVELSLTIKNTEPLWVATLYDTYGYALQLAGGADNLLTCLRIYKQCIDLRTKYYVDVSNEDIANCLHNLGCAYNSLGGAANLAQSISYHEKALSMRNELHAGTHHSSVISSMIHVATARTDEGGINNLNCGLQLMSTALVSAGALYGDAVHPVTTSIYAGLGHIYLRLGGLDNLLVAHDYFTKALAYQQELMPDSYATLACTYSALGDVFTQLSVANANERIKHLEKNLEYRTIAVSLYNQLYSDDARPAYAKALLDLCLGYICIGVEPSDEKAIAIATKALEQHNILYPADHPEVLCCLNVLAYLNSPSIHMEKTAAVIPSAGDSSPIEPHSHASHPSKVDEAASDRLCPAGTIERKGTVS